MNQTPETYNAFRSGFIAIIGAPNVGKSTLLNRMLGQKISITSEKPQTTRNRILGVLHRPGAQLIFIDTPGVHKAGRLLNVRIVEQALSALGDVDAVLLMADASSPAPESEDILIKNLRKRKQPVILALNKIDLVKKPNLLSLIDQWANQYPFKAIIPISARNGTQVEEIPRTLEEFLPFGPAYYPEDTLTDVPERFIAAEMIREKAFRLTGQEVPYSIAVTIDSFKEDSGKALVHISATLHVERDSQKGIIIGKKGSKLKAIGEAARKDIERMLGTRVFLQLFVRVQKGWSKDSRALNRFGY
ncbi:MAG: GTPase Era [Desulfobacterales bacterium]|nr:GTPase Era [Desulfobacterales bacterium]MDD4071701.1 GTPase Era [Desulfobacterales bacterium]MDD4391395.1 GTPase Era [Desulfobacterales bacterium]